MERRVVLVGLAALATGPALAQSNPPPPTDAPAATVPTPSAPAPELAPTPAMKVAPPSGGDVSAAVTEHMKRTIAAGSLSLAASRLALTKVKNATLKQFAEFETAEQDTIADIFKGKMMPDARPMGVGEVKAPTDAAVTGNLDQKGKDLLEKLRAMKAGPEFDRDYVKAQVQGHRELLAIQDTYLKVADDRDETNVAKLAKGMIKEHLTLLADIEKKIG